MDPKHVRGEAYRRLEHAHFKHPEKGTLPFALSQAKIDNVVDALRAVVELDTKAAAPCWTGTAGPVQPSANEIVPMKNGLLHVPTRTPQSHTSYFFYHHSLEFAYAGTSSRNCTWYVIMDLKITRSGQTIVKPTALGPVANTDTKLLTYGLFQKG